MNVLFFVICTLSVLFFAVFLFECSRPVRKPQKAPVVRKSKEAAAIDSATGRRFLVHLEQQMAEFLSRHGRTTAGLLIVLALTPLMLRAENGQSGTARADDPPASSARSLSSESEQNSGAAPGSMQSGSSSSDGPKTAGAEGPGWGHRRSYSQQQYFAWQFLRPARGGVHAGLERDGCQWARAALPRISCTADHAAVSVCSLALRRIGDDRLPMDPVGAPDAGHLERLQRRGLETERRPDLWLVQWRF